MSLLSYPELVEVVDSGILSLVTKDRINPTSVDLTLAPKLLFEARPDPRKESSLIDLGRRESVTWRSWEMADEPGMDYYDLQPGEFILASTNEKFYMPNYLSAEFSLKSSLARKGLEHLLAGWIDPGFNDSVLTLELKNITRHHVLRLRVGMPIGQVKFFRHTEVPEEHSYSARGRYNHDQAVQGIKK